MKHPSRRRAAQRGYVLMFVMGALVLMAFVAARLASRVDQLREHARTLQGYADGRTAAYSARSRAFYWLVTRPTGYVGSGFLDEKQLVHDGRPYLTPEGAWLSVQDDRGLLPLNKPAQDLLLPALMGMGASFEQASQMIAVLEDYVDEDGLRRLNGAEVGDYRERGLLPPRNARLLMADELARMPVWREHPDIRERMLDWGGLRSQHEMNPNTAPLALLKLTWPRISDSQWDIFETLRTRAPFPSAAAAAAATGIPFTDQLTAFRASDALRLRIWAPGLPQTLEYNLWLLPGGVRAPWFVHAVSLRPRPKEAAPESPFAASRVENLPTPSPDFARPPDPATVAP